MKQIIPNIMFFRLHFSIDFGRVWGGFLAGFGRSLEGLGTSWVAFCRHFWRLVFRTLSKMALGGFWIPFWLNFQGFGRDLRGVLGEFVEPKSAFLLVWVFGFRVQFVGAFRKVWDENKVP